MDTKEKIAVLQAFERGEKIQQQNKYNAHAPWINSGHPTWDFLNWNYRVAQPTPKVVFINHYPTEDTNCHLTYELAKRFASSKCLKVGVKYIEVTPEIEAVLKDKNLI